MLHLSLTAVDRGDAHLREQIPPDHAMWNDTGVELATPLVVDLTATDVGEGVLVRGTLATTVRQACRRCLEPVEQEVREHVDLLFTEPAQGDDDVDDGEVYPLPTRGD
ncbi:MAG TPA: YceD family protein, partial [Longimicrobium sp.]|nr:YceD family protein [Longimicrobium sp.]